GHVVCLCQLGDGGTSLRDHQRGDRLLTLFGIHAAPSVSSGAVWEYVRFDVVLVGFTTFCVDLSRIGCNLLHMTVSSAPSSQVPNEPSGGYPAGTVLRGVPVVSGVQYAPVIRPGRLPVVDEAATAGALDEADRPAEAGRFLAAATVVANRLRDRAAHATGAAAE